MNFVKVNYHLNQNYYVEDVAFLQIVKKAISSTSEVKLHKAEVKLDMSSNAFNLFLEIEKSENITYEETCNKIQNDIEEYSYLLLASKPKNIQIIFREKNERSISN